MAFLQVAVTLTVVVCFATLIEARGRGGGHGTPRRPIGTPKPTIGSSDDLGFTTKLENSNGELYNNEAACTLVGGTSEDASTTLDCGVTYGNVTMSVCKSTFLDLTLVCQIGTATVNFDCTCGEDIFDIYVSGDDPVPVQFCQNPTPEEGSEEPIKMEPGNWGPPTLSANDFAGGFTQEALNECIEN